MGMKTAAGGGGRKVLDRNYFLSELRTKRMEVANITQQMTTELEALEKRQGQYSQMETHSSRLLKEVKGSQESLADYNTVLDKVGSQTPTYLIQQEISGLRERNEVALRRVEEVVTRKLDFEDKSRKTDGRIAEMQANSESRLASLQPQQRQQYMMLVQEQTGLAHEGKRFEEAIDELDRQLTTQEGELARNPLKQRSLQLQDQIRQLTERKYELAQEEERSKAGPEEQREALMSKVKRDNAEADQITGKVKELQEGIRRMETRISTLSGNSPQINAQEEAAKREKFEELVAKERDLTNFMESFPSRRAAKMDEARATQDAIVQRLDRITKLHNIAGGVLPSTKQFKEMQDELEYKQLQLENTQMTQDRLKEELIMRRSELDKIDTLEDKIKKELDQLDIKSGQLKTDIETQSNVGDLREKAEATRSRLEVSKVALAGRRDLLRTTAAEKTLKHQARRGQLQENTVQIAIDKLEGKLRSLNTNVYTMSEFIRHKESETNYKVLAHTIAQLAEEVNTSVKNSVA